MMRQFKRGLASLWSGSVSLWKRLPAPSSRAIAVLLVVLIGLGLRMYRLDAQSFWYDEGNSVRIAERSIQLIIEGAAGDIHPPLYYLALHFWRAVMGDSEAALRGLSVACGTLVILFTYLLGTSLTAKDDPRTGLIAALLVAFSPFAIYYSQEARMYEMLALLALISTWSLVKLGSRQAGGLFAAAYVIATAAGLYTQYAYPFVMVAQGMCVLLWLATHRTNLLHKVLTYTIINLIALGLYLPWLPIAIRQITAWGVASQTYDLGQAMLDAFRWLVVGRTLPLALGETQLALAVIALLSLTAVVYSLATMLSHALRQDLHRSTKSTTKITTTPAVIYLLILALLPFVLLFAFKLYREAYLKFLLVCLAPLMLLTAHGLTSLPQICQAIWNSLIAPANPSTTHLSRLTFYVLRFTFYVCLPALVIAGVMLPSLNNLYNNPTFARDNYRGIARMIEADAHTGDAILFSAPNQWEVFTYYHRTGAPAIPLIYRPINAAAVDEQMKPIAAQYQRLFVLYYAERESDPSSWYERWLAEHAYKAEEQWVGNIRLAIYAALPQTATSSEAALPATFGTTIALTGATITAGDTTSGDLVALKLTWRALTKPAGRYKMFVHMGGVDTPPVAQNDAEPVAGFRPTDTWNAGEDVTDQRAVWLKPGIAPGRYGVYIGIVDAATGQRLPITSGHNGGNRLWLGDIVVTAGQ